MVNANTKFTMNTSNAQLAARNAARQPPKKGKGKVRYVRTAAGQKRYGRSIGDVIVAGEKMQNIKHEDPVYPGWDLIRGKNGVKYDVGKIKGKFVAYVHNSQDGLAITADSHEDLLRQLNKRVDKVEQTIKPKYDRLGTEKRVAPDGTPIEDDDDDAQGLTKRPQGTSKGTSERSSARTSSGTSTASQSRNGRSSTSSKTTAQRAREQRQRDAEVKRKRAAKAKAVKMAEKGEYEGSSLTGIRQLTGLALGTGGKDSVQNRKRSEELMRILQKQGLVQPYSKPKTARKDPLAERRGKTSSDALKWEPVEGFTMSQVARSIRYDVAIDRILFQWDEDRRNSKA